MNELFGVKMERVSRV